MVQLLVAFPLLFCGDGSLINAFCQGQLDNYGPRQGKILAGNFALNDGVSADFPQIYFI